MKTKKQWAAALACSLSPAFIWGFNLPSMAVTPAKAGVQASQIFDGGQQADNCGLILVKTLRKTERAEPYFDNRSVRLVTEVKRYRIADREKYAGYLAGEKGCNGSFWGALFGLSAGVLAALLTASLWPALAAVIAGAVTGCLLGRNSGVNEARHQKEEFETTETKISETE